MFFKSIDFQKTNLFCLIENIIKVYINIRKIMEKYCYLKFRRRNEPVKQQKKVQSYNIT